MQSANVSALRLDATNSIVNGALKVSSSGFANVPFDEIEIGQSASMARQLTMDDIELFATVSGNSNPLMLDEKYATGSEYHGIIGHGMWSGALVSGVLGSQLPMSSPQGLSDGTGSCSKAEKHANNSITNATALNRKCQSNSIQPDTPGDNLR